MTHARHRLFDAKRRDGWHTYMRGNTMHSAWRVRVIWHGKAKGCNG